MPHIRHLGFQKTYTAFLMCELPIRVLWKQIFLKCYVHYPRYDIAQWNKYALLHDIGLQRCNCIFKNVITPLQLECLRDSKISSGTRCLRFLLLLNWSTNFEIPD